MKVTRRQLNNIIHELLFENKEIQMPIPDDLKSIVKKLTASNIDVKPEEISRIAKVFEYFQDKEKGINDIIDEINTHVFILDFMLQIAGLGRDSKIKNSIVSYYEMLRLQGKDISPFMVIGLAGHMIKHFDYKAYESLHAFEIEAFELISFGFLEALEKASKVAYSKEKQNILINLFKYFIVVPNRSTIGRISIEFVNPSIRKTLGISAAAHEEAVDYFRKLFKSLVGPTLNNWKKKAEDSQLNFQNDAPSSAKAKLAMIDLM